MFLSPLSPVLLHNLIVSDDDALSQGWSLVSLKYHFYPDQVLFLVFALESVLLAVGGQGVLWIT